MNSLLTSLLLIITVFANNAICQYGARYCAAVYRSCLSETIEGRQYDLNNWRPDGRWVPRPPPPRPWPGLGGRECIRRCLAQGQLHPSQCHSLC